jgi:hypothetical protein
VILPSAELGNRYIRPAKLSGAIGRRYWFSAALHHNNSSERMAQLADRECRIIALESLRSGKASVVQDPPRILNGIAFFANGLPECVAMQSPGAAATVEFSPELSSPPPGTPVFVWDEANYRFWHLGQK